MKEVIIIYTIIKKHQLQSVWVLLIIGLVIALCDMGSVHLFKNTFERLRPCHSMENVRLVTQGCGGQFGFISSHASNVFGLTMILGQVFKHRWLFIGLFFWSSLISFSRIYVGVHYPFDVLAGMLWGTFVALSCYSIYARFLKK